MPALMIASSMKKNRLSRIGADSSRPQAPLSFSPCARVGAACAIGWPPLPMATSSAAAAKPRTAAPTNAPRQPHCICIISRVTGATAEPSMPAKVCIEKAWPMWRAGTCCDSKA